MKLIVNQVAQNRLDQIYSLFFSWAEIYMLIFASLNTKYRLRIKEQYPTVYGTNV